MRDLTTNQVEDRLRAAGLPGSRPTIIRWSDQGILPCYRTIGGRYRYYRPEVIDLLIKLYRQGNTDVEQIRDQLKALHDELADRERDASGDQENAG